MNEWANVVSSSHGKFVEFHAGTTSTSIRPSAENWRYKIARTCFSLNTHQSPVNYYAIIFIRKSHGWNDEDTNGRPNDDGSEWTWHKKQNKTKFYFLGNIIFFSIERCNWATEIIKYNLLSFHFVVFRTQSMILNMKILSKFVVFMELSRTTAALGAAAMATRCQFSLN